MVRLKNKKVGIILEQTNRVSKLTFYRMFKKLKADVTPEQWVILDALYNENDLRQTELGEIAFKDKPTISRIIDNTCQKKYTKRITDKDDRRKFKIRLMAKGRKLVEKCLPEINKLRKSSWKGLSQQDYLTFQRITQQLRENFEQYK